MGAAREVAAVYTLDTNAVIYYLKGEFASASAAREVFEGDAPVYVSVITQLELLSFPSLTDAEASRIEELLATIALIPVDSQIARLAAGVRRAYRIGVSDSVIAATALFTGSTLLTRNVRDFMKVKGLSVRRM
ncbi:MAG: type II toxin-antitoxin system VapC family toxin [Candidatus Liptonbacteria bacterium]|nr:type II toxin-antitoxin system VapC family toxin [Candidatus Liptonbacteria bacterium]MBI3114687.1 type II toxin-antitoxin system VapC family toxin [Candidatus Harrisonbacteria bacterium]